MKIKILKGTNQIGGCITEISSDCGTKILIDYGCDLDKEEDHLPDIEWKDYQAVFITHNHDDHIGHLCEIPHHVPVYVEETSFEVYKILNAFLKEKRTLREVNTFTMGDVIQIQDITVTSYLVDHSAFHSCMFLIECDGKRCLHMGDFRNNGRLCSLENTLKEISFVDALIMEGTTLSREESRNLTEEELQKEIEAIASQYDQVLILQSSTNIDRIYTMYHAMKNTGKIFLEDICTANICHYLNQAGNPDIPDVQKNDVFSFLPFRRREDYTNPSDFYKEYILPFNKNDGHKKLFHHPYALMVKQSMLPDIKRRYLDGNLNHACLIYSMWEGYLEQKEFIQFMEKIKEMGIDIYFKHTSGHADEVTRKMVLNVLKYNYLFPIHTEKKEVYQAYKNAYILEDNELFEVV